MGLCRRMPREIGYSVARKVGGSRATTFRRIVGSLENVVNFILGRCATLEHAGNRLSGE